MKPVKWRFEVLLSLIEENGYSDYLEIGLGAGTTMAYLMQHISDPDFRFYGVDPYKAYSGLHKRGLKFKQDAFDANKRRVDNLFWSSERGKFFNMFSHEAAEKLEDSFDIIFIDGNHTYAGVLQDLKDWYPKLREGGTFAGHDYYNKKGHHYYCVTQAVEEFAKSIDKKVLTAPDHVWYFTK